MHLNFLRAPRPLGKPLEDAATCARPSPPQARGERAQPLEPGRAGANFYCAALVSVTLSEPQFPYLVGLP